MDKVRWYGRVYGVNGVIRDVTTENNYKCNCTQVSCKTMYVNNHFLKSTFKLIKS